MSWPRRFGQRLVEWWAQPGPRKWRGVAMVLPFLLVMALVIGYTNYVQRESDERWCELIVLLDEQYQGTQQETEVLRRFAEALHRLRTQLPCREVG